MTDDIKTTDEPARDPQEVLLQMIRETKESIRMSEIRLAALKEALRVIEALR